MHTAQSQKCHLDMEPTYKRMTLCSPRRMTYTMHTAQSQKWMRTSMSPLPRSPSAPSPSPPSYFLKTPLPHRHHIQQQKSSAHTLHHYNHICLQHHTFPFQPPHFFLPRLGSQHLRIHNHIHHQHTPHHNLHPRLSTQPHCNHKHVHRHPLNPCQGSPPHRIHKHIHHHHHTPHHLPHPCPSAQPHRNHKHVRHYLFNARMSTQPHHSHHNHIHHHGHVLHHLFNP